MFRSDVQRLAFCFITYPKCKSLLNFLADLSSLPCFLFLMLLFVLMFFNKLNLHRRAVFILKWNYTHCLWLTQTYVTLFRILVVKGNLKTVSLPLHRSQKIPQSILKVIDERWKRPPPKKYIFKHSEYFCNFYLFHIQRNKVKILSLNFTDFLCLPSLCLHCHRENVLLLRCANFTLLFKHALHIFFSFLFFMNKYIWIK